MHILATPLSAGSKALQILLHLNKRLHHVWCGFFIARIFCGNRLVASLVEELPVEHRALGSVSVYRDSLLFFDFYPTFNQGKRIIANPAA